MKTITVALSVLPLVLTLVSPFTHAGIVTFDFFNLIQNQSSNISGRLADGSDYVGPPLATPYEYFSWDQGVTLTARTQRALVDENYEPIGEYLPAYAYLQPGFAGIGTCTSPSCSSASEISYLDKLLLDFSEVVDIINIEFGNGNDETWWPSEEEWKAETGQIWDLDEDYRAYDSRIVASGGPLGTNSSLGGSRDSWNGLLVGNHLEFYYNEGTGYYLESITVRTADIPEPQTWGLMLIGLLSFFVAQRAREKVSSGLNLDGQSAGLGFAA